MSLFFIFFLTTFGKAWGYSWSSVEHTISPSFARIFSEWKSVKIVCKCANSAWHIEQTFSVHRVKCDGRLALSMNDSLRSPEAHLNSALQLCELLAGPRSVWFCHSPLKICSSRPGSKTLALASAVKAGMFNWLLVFNL